MNEKRKYKRARIDIDVSFQIAKREEWLIGKMMNLSGGGICLISKEAYGIANALDLRFMVPDSDNAIEVSAVVAWEQYNIDENRYEIGIQFTEIKEKDRILIEKFVAQETFMAHRKP
jgi:c-di-GMP-binding flagellar brake protein YcgR